MSRGIGLHRRGQAAHREIAEIAVALAVANLGGHVLQAVVLGIEG